MAFKKQVIDPKKGKLNLIQLKYKPTKLKNKPLNGSKEIADFVRKLFDKGNFSIQEQCILLILDAEDYPIGYYPLSLGTKHECPIDYQLILKILLLTQADSFVIAHNHPTGPPHPSDPDINSVLRLKLQADFIEVTYLDDIILSTDSHFSFADSGNIVGFGE